jgi:hypothetical protein
LRRFALLLLFVAVVARAADEPLVGRWRTVEDPSTGVVSIIELYLEGETMSGRVERIEDPSGKPLFPICEDCPGDMAGKPLPGLRFLSGLRKDGDRWVDGRAIDLRDGLTQGVAANCDLELVDGKAVLRAWVGVRALGETRVWTRETPRR